MEEKQNKPQVIEGRKTEERFAKLFDDHSFSNINEDRHEHWDVKISLKVDVKGLKKINRSDSKPNEMFHYIELRNVNGDKGWLYGKADLFAFETEDYWVLVESERLREFIATKVSKEKVTRAKDSLYKFYQRKTQKDLITMVKTIDLMAIAKEIKFKDNEIEKSKQS